ncbi:hypothetical protein GQ44DRAFT_726467 [Phaeosphaeriaceae sp. PMI808]|nr:hypothetical protein GQ44DRAFT_726467 [Phaeosphaeriaceae sp. PMI808]
MSLLAYAWLYPLFVLFFAYIIVVYYDNTPAIIEYAPEDVAQRDHLQIKAHTIELTITLKRGQSSTLRGNSAVKHRLERKISVVIVSYVQICDKKHRTMYITGKSKRVRQLLKEHGGFSAENKYGQNIKDTLRKLQASEV